MDRRDFLKLTTSTAVAGMVPDSSGLLAKTAREEPLPDATAFYVSPSGNDRNPGTEARPFASIHRAQEAVRALSRRTPVSVWLREGTHYLAAPLTFTPSDSGSPGNPVTYAAYPGESVLLSGGRRLNCAWMPFRNGIMKTSVPRDAVFSQLFVNGKRQIRARYPNYDPSVPGKTGYLRAAGAIPDSVPDPRSVPDADMTFAGGAPRGVEFNPATFTTRKWAHPEEAEIHIFQGSYWGNLMWRLKAVDRNQNLLWFGEGGQQLGAKWSANPCLVNSKSRFFVENIFEELDAPGEWFLDKAASILYYYPPHGIDLQHAVIEVPQQEHVIHFAGSQAHPVENIAIRNVRLSHTLTTYMSEYDVPSLSDWSIHRGGAVFVEGTRDCSVRSCWFDAVGGNAVFVNNFNRGFVVSECKFTDIGDSAICFVGDLAQTTGTQRAFPFECRAHNNLIHDCGFYGKQVAGVYISRARRITLSHNLIYNMPRAAICLGDGTWGGHVVEFNETHDTVLETSDHGPFNAWGRDRGWCLSQSHGPYTVNRSIDVWEALVDVMEPVIVRNNLFVNRTPRPGWGLNLDDGASNYKIYNNISIGVSFKWREGAYREVYNNIWYQSRVAPAFHVGNNDNHDRYYNNITVMESAATEFPEGWPQWPQMFHSVIAPPADGPWFDEVDRNLYYVPNGEFQAVVDQLRRNDGRMNPQRYNFSEWQALGWDRNSVFADPLFVDPGHNDFQVKPESPALPLGFKNFEMGKWGLTEDFPEHWASGTPHLSTGKDQQS